IAAPARITQAHFLCDVLETIAAQVLVQDGALGALGKKMTREGIRKADVCTAAPFFISGVATNIADVQIQQAVVVVVEEDSTRGMTDVVNSGRLGNVPEMTSPIIFEQDIAAANCCNEEVLVSVVVDVGKRGCDADTIGECDTGRCGDVC